jgi:hypothetical protein
METSGQQLEKVQSRIRKIYSMMGQKNKMELWETERHKIDKNHKRKDLSMHSITLSARINGSREELSEHFRDLEKFGKLHPLIRKVTMTGSNTFLINESLLLLGFIPMKPEYSAEVIEADGCIIYNSHVKKGVDLRIIFSFSTDPEGYTTITERVDVSANVLVARILLHTIQKAHTEIFRALEKLVTA